MSLVSQAVAFAAKMHEGMKRKGTDIPYIVHPVEVAGIVASITDDEHVIAAALLHDVMEDCGVTRQELEMRFGMRVAQLVEGETQKKEGDPCDTWEIRKRAAIEHLRHAGRDSRLIALGDKLSNMRAICRDYEREGDAMFSKFHQHDKARHAWYYHGVEEQLRKDFDHLDAFRELENLIVRVFSSVVDLETLSAEDGFAV